MAAVMYCPDCRTNLDATPVGDPCPKCSGSRRSAVALPEAVPMRVEVLSPRVIAESNFDDGSKGAVVGSADFRSTTYRSSSGERHEFTGRPVRGESDVLQVCESLQEALRRRGVTMVGKFRAPTGPESGVDAEGDTAAGSVLRVRVIGVIDQQTMAELGREGRSSSEKDVLQLADEVRAAIKKKIDSYPASVRRGVTLALDAIRSPGHATAEVVEALRSGSCSEMLRSTGFDEIWLVGPTDHVYRLDNSLCRLRTDVSRRPATRETRAAESYGSLGVLSETWCTLSLSLGHASR
jgi:hypothetical protein